MYTCIHTHTHTEHAYTHKTHKCTRNTCTQTHTLPDNLFHRPKKRFFGKASSYQRFLLTPIALHQVGLEKLQPRWVRVPLNRLCYVDLAMAQAIARLCLLMQV